MSFKFIHNLTLFFLLFLCNIIVAQELKTYSGEYQLGDGSNLMGECSYQYYENSEDERIKDGFFSWSAGEHSMVIGTYSNNLLSGEWKYIFKDSLCSYKIIGSYINGKRNGEWSCQISPLEIGESSKILFLFNNDTLSFTAKTLALGKDYLFDRQGNLSGSWEYNSDSLNEYIAYLNRFSLNKDSSLFKKGHEYQLEIKENIITRFLEREISTGYLDCRIDFTKEATLEDSEIIEYGNNKIFKVKDNFYYFKPLLLNIKTEYKRGISPPTPKNSLPCEGVESFLENTLRSSTRLLSNTLGNIVFASFIRMDTIDTQYAIALVAARDSLLAFDSLVAIGDIAYVEDDKSKALLYYETSLKIEKFLIRENKESRVRSLALVKERLIELKDVFFRDNIIRQSDSLLQLNLYKESIALLTEAKSSNPIYTSVYDSLISNSILENVLIVVDSLAGIGTIPKAIEMLRSSRGFSLSFASQSHINIYDSLIQKYQKDSLTMEKECINFFHRAEKRLYEETGLFSSTLINAKEIASNIPPNYRQQYKICIIHFKDKFDSLFVDPNFMVESMKINLSIMTYDEKTSTLLKIGKAIELTKALNSDFLSFVKNIMIASERNRKKFAIFKEDNINTIINSFL